MCQFWRVLKCHISTTTVLLVRPNRGAGGALWMGFAASGNPKAVIWGQRRFDLMDWVWAGADPEQTIREGQKMGWVKFGRRAKKIFWLKAKLLGRLNNSIIKKWRTTVCKLIKGWTNCDFVRDQLCFTDLQRGGAASLPSATKVFFFLLGLVLDFSLGSKKKNLMENRVFRVFQFWLTLIFACKAIC